MTKEEQAKVNKQMILKELKESGTDNNDEIAVILNVLSENLSLLKDTKSKSDLIALLDRRAAIKEKVKGE